MKTMFVAFFVICGFVQSIAAQQSPKSVAVIEFYASGGLSKTEAQSLTNRFRGLLVNTGKFSVVERQKMNEILKEQDFSVSDNCNTKECAVQVGQLLGVENMIAGDIGRVGLTWTVDLQLIDVSTGKIIVTKSKNYKGETDGLLEVMESIANAFAGVKSETVQNIVQPVAVQPAANNARKPVGEFAMLFNPLGLFQFGPMIQAEFKVSPTMVVGPHIRFLGLGLATKAVSDYDKFSSSSMAIGGGIKSYMGEPDAQNRWVGGLSVEYGFGGGTDPGAKYKFSYLGLAGNYGYRWRFNSPGFVGLGIVAAYATELSDYRSSPSRINYPKKTFFFGMVEFNVGFEK